MTCGGCSTHAPPADPRPAFAMCWTCPDRAPKRRDPCPVFAELTLNGRVFAPTGRTCPRGRWPDAEGYVHTAIGAFIGVPFYLRWRLALEGAWAAFRQRMGPDYLPACGCYALLRETWDAFFGAPAYPPRVIDSRAFDLDRSAA